MCVSVTGGLSVRLISGPPSSPRLTLPLICSNGLPFMRQGMGELDVKDVTEVNGADGRQRVRVRPCRPPLQTE